MARHSDQDWLNFTTTAELKVPERLIDQVIGQERAVEIIKKAAAQKRNVLLVGAPGTGKTMLARAMAELLPASELVDILIVENPRNENAPLVQITKAGEGRKKIAQEALTRAAEGNPSLIFLLAGVAMPFLLLLFGRSIFGDIITAALLISSFAVLALLIVATQITKMRSTQYNAYNLIVDNAGKRTAPFVDATGAKAGALLSDVLHDPLQSGGLGTPPHLRVRAGAVHLAHKGVLYIDEIASLRPLDQQELLTAMQEKRLPITGRSELSSGALVKTEPVPCDFVLVAAGNYHDIARIHPALRSRIRGYGYEVYMESDMPDNQANVAALARFVAQEVAKDGRIPHFTKEAVLAIVNEARRRATRKGRLSLQLRDLGGLIRAAGDLARSDGARLVQRTHVERALALARTLEQQIVDQAVEQKREYQVFATKGCAIGVVNGLALLGDTGLIQPIAAEVVPPTSRQEGRIIATGRLGVIAREAIANVAAPIKRYTGKDLTRCDIHIQFLQCPEGVEGDSASISVATATISALERIPVKQSVAMTGSLTVRGELLPVGGIQRKIEAAARAGIKAVIIPASNAGDVISPIVRIIYARTLIDVLRHALKPCRAKAALLQKLNRSTKTKARQ